MDGSNEELGFRRRISRRSLLEVMPAVAGTALALCAEIAMQPARAQANIPHAVAKYQDMPKNGQECSTCAQFLPPKACKLVASPISPHGWCMFYLKKS